MITTTPVCTMVQTSEVAGREQYSRDIVMVVALGRISQLSSYTVVIGTAGHDCQ